MPKLPQFTAPQTEAQQPFDWFVYGSSLDFDAFRSWCGEHGYVPPDLGAAKPARLPGWRLAFNVRSNFWGGVVASLVEAPGSHVEGVLLPMPAETLGFVRHKEGVVSGLYEERTGPCETTDGEPRTCHFYVANPIRTAPEAPPAPRFLAVLKKGARERNLSADWIATLDAADRSA